MKIAFGYNAWDEKAIEYHERFVACGKKIGIDVFSVIVTPDPPRARLQFKELDRKVLLKNRKISKFRDSIIEKIKDADVFWLFNGANFHPAWFSLLPDKQLKVLGFHDDPESSATIALPVAPYFDVCLLSNISAIPYYQGHARRIAEWLPLFISEDAPILVDKDFSAADRPYGLVFCGERQSPWRRNRFDFLQKNFPDGQFWGKGWPNGFAQDLGALYRKAKIGINIHNSTGPINVRLNELPAHGVMQICDNKCRLGHIYQLGNEVVGFDYIDEAVDLLRYYLDPAHDDERAQIALNGYQRYMKDYTMEKIWTQAMEKFSRWHAEKEAGAIVTPKYHRKSLYDVIKPIAKNFILPSFRMLKENFNKYKHEKEYGIPLHPIEDIESQNCISLSLHEKMIPTFVTNPELGPLNMQVRDEIKEECGFFEYPNMVALNWAVAGLVGEAKRILEIGSGTGVFAFEAAQDPGRTILALEEESGARNWAIKHRSLPNITYAAKSLDSFKSEFDLIVSIDVIEHIANYQDMLKECVRLAPKAIFTTPNRLRNSPVLLQPSYSQHVQEWGPEGFYYMLRAYYKNVYLLSMPDCYIPLTKPINGNSRMSPLIAVCDNS